MAALYESIRRNDFMVVDDSKIDSFDWDNFFRDEYVGLYSSVLIESFEKIVDKQPIPVGVQDVYSIELRNGLKFVLNISYNDAEQIRSQSKAGITEADYKGRHDIVDGYETFKNIQDGQYVALLEFKDAKGGHGRTGEVGVSSQELFSMLKSGILDSFINGGMMDKLVGIMMLVDKNDPKRMRLYTKMLERGFKAHFPNIFVDDNIKSMANVDVLIASK